MINIKKKVIIILAFLLVLSSFGYAYTFSTPFTNGSFETGDLTDWTVSVVRSDVADTTVSGSNNVASGDASDGSFSFDMNVGVGLVGQNNKLHFRRNIMLNTLDVNLTHDLNITFDFKLVSASLGTPHLLISYTEAGTGNLKLYRDNGSCVTDNNLNVSDITQTLTGSNYSTFTFGVPTCVNMDATKPLTISFKYEVSCGGSCSSHTANWKVDNLRFSREITPILINTFLAPTDDIPVNNLFTIRVKVTNDVNSLVVPDADVNFTFNSVEQVAVFSVANQWYESTFTAPSSPQVLDVTVESSKSGFVSDSDSFSITFIRSEFQYLTITPIQNIASFSFGSVDFIPINQLGTMIWRVDSNSSVSETPTFKIFNGRTDGRQYFIYTSSDGVNYAFDDTLTFGSTNENPIQKIWDNVARFYTYSFDDTLTANETKYYKLTYQSPYRHWFSIADSEEWLNLNVPNVLDQNVIFVDEYTISSFTNIRSILKEEVPDVFEDQSQAFEFQFTAYSDVNETLLYAGITKENSFDNDSVESITLTNTPKRFSITIDATDFDSQLLFKSANTTSAKVFVTDYAIVSRGFFTKRLELFKANNDALDVFLFNSFSTRYIQEGLEFKINSGAYDREGSFNQLILEAYLDGTSANDLVSSFTFDLKTGREAESIESFDKLFPPIIDLNGTANNPDPPRSLILRARITDDNSVTVAIQSQTIMFLQYPYFPNDLDFQFFPTEKRKGKHPTGLLELRMKNISVLEALDLRIYSDGNSVNAPNFRETIYKGTDFECLFDKCSLNITVDDYVFEDVNLTTITWFAILNTEYLDQDNNLTRIDRRIFVSEIGFGTAKILQVGERPRNIYRNDEEIPVVMILRDSEADTLLNKIQVYVQIQNCDSNSSPNCVTQNIQYKPTGFLYDKTNNANLYFFTHLYVLDDGSLLPDGNYISFVGTVIDKTGARTTINPLLTSRCSSNLFETALGVVVGGLKTFISPDWALQSEITTSICTSGLNEEVVSLTSNSDQQQFLFIDETFSRTSPVLVNATCIHPNARSGLANPLNEKIVCAIQYTAGEKPIDAFRFRISNEFSEFSKTGSDKQFYEVPVPFEVIAYNDKQFLFNSLKDNYTTSISLRDVLFNGFKKLSSISLDLSNITSSTQLEDILVFDSDVDLDYTFTSNDLNGFFFWTVEKLSIVNAQDYSFEPKIKSEFENIPRTSFFQYLNSKNVRIPLETIKTRIYVDSLAEPFEIRSDDRILIDEKVSDNRIIPQADQNTTFTSLPATLFFQLGITMFYNNFSESKVLNKTLDYYVIIKENTGNAFLKFWENLLEKPVETITDFLLKNLFMIMILLILTIIGGVLVVLYTRR